jgi:hypothetical protein
MAYPVTSCAGRVASRFQAYTRARRADGTLLYKQRA